MTDMPANESLWRSVTEQGFMLYEAIRCAGLIEEESRRLVALADEVLEGAGLLFLKTGAPPVLRSQTPSAARDRELVVAFAEVERTLADLRIAMLGAARQLMEAERWEAAQAILARLVDTSPTMPEASALLDQLAATCYGRVQGQIAAMLKPALDGMTSIEGTVNNFLGKRLEDEQARQRAYAPTLKAWARALEKQFPIAVNLKEYRDLLDLAATMEGGGSASSGRDLKGWYLLSLRDALLKALKPRLGGGKAEPAPGEREASRDDIQELFDPIFDFSVESDGDADTQSKELGRKLRTVLRELAKKFPDARALDLYSSLKSSCEYLQSIGQLFNEYTLADIRARSSALIEELLDVLHP